MPNQWLCLKEHSAMEGEGEMVQVYQESRRNGRGLRSWTKGGIVHLWLIGIDDTDNLESRGTGHRARQLARTLETREMGQVVSVTRHQLLVHPDIPYTSHNSSACLTLKPAGPKVTGPGLQVLCAEFLERDCAPGSDPGLCVASQVAADRVSSFGRRAKTEIVTKGEALGLARELGIHLSEHGGTGGGVIGALAAVGLCAGGTDGRYLYLRGIRDLAGEHSAAEIMTLSDIDEITTLDGSHPAPSDPVDVGTWFRPVRLGGRAVLLVQPVESGGTTKSWRILDRQEIKQY